MILSTAISLAVAVSAVPAWLAQDPTGSDQSNPAGTANQTGERQTHRELRSGAGISLVIPTGKIFVGAGPASGGSVYERRTTDDGITIVEVSATPFMPVLQSSGAPTAPTYRADQPAGW